MHNVRNVRECGGSKSDEEVEEQKDLTAAVLSKCLLKVTKCVDQLAENDPHWERSQTSKEKAWMVC